MWRYPANRKALPAMGYIPEVNDRIVFTNTYDAVTEYRVNAVTDGRLTVEPVEVPEGFTAFTVNLSLETANDMGITTVAKPGPDVAEIDALAFLLAMATLEYLDKLEAAMAVNATFGPALASVIFPLDELVEDLAALTVMAAIVDVGYEAAGVVRESMADAFTDAEKSYREAVDTSRGL